MNDAEMAELKGQLGSFNVEEQAGMWIISKKDNDEMLAMVSTDGPLDQVKGELQKAGVI